MFYVIKFLCENVPLSGVLQAKTGLFSCPLIATLSSPSKKAWSKTKAYYMHPGTVLFIVFSPLTSPSLSTPDRALASLLDGSLLKARGDGSCRVYHSEVRGILRT